MKKTGAVIVAAGLSSRMKEFKPSLPFEDSNVANHTIKKLKKLGIEPIVIVVGHKSEELKKSIYTDSVRYVENKRYSETQMFDSVILGVEDISNECDRILIMPIDLPAILETTLEKVISIDAELVRTTFQDKPGHPIIISSRFASNIKNYDGDGGLRGAMESFDAPITNVDVDDEAVYFDIDTPEEYHRLIEWNYERGGGYPVKPKIEIKLEARENFFDETAYKLIKNIQTYKSLQKACVKTDVSYSKGSRMIKNIERQLGFHIVEKWTGGSNGGGTSVTPEGIRLLENYEKFVKEVNEIAEQKYKECFAMGLRK